MKHTKLEYPICQNGFKTKTINIRTQAGKTKFLLQQVNELGLPHDAQILAFWCREHVSTITSSNGLTLTTAAVFDNSYISLKDRANPQNKIDLILSESYVPKLATKAFFMQPVPSTLIDWNQSFIQINPRATAADGQVFEIVVIYTDPCDIELFPNRFIFRDGLELAGVRQASFEVKLNSTQIQYPLSNSDNVGLPTDAVILGFNLRNNLFPLTGTTGVSSIAAFNNIYFTLKQGTDAFISEFPAALTNYEQLISSLDYMPITPTQVQAIDWQQSKIEITDNTGVTNDMVFQFSLIWWTPKC